VTEGRQGEERCKAARVAGAALRLYRGMVVTVKRKRSEKPIMPTSTVLPLGKYLLYGQKGRCKPQRLPLTFGNRLRVEG
jgi:hypothetical protein